MNRMTSVQVNLGFENLLDAASFVNAILKAQPMAAIRVESYLTAPLEGIDKAPENDVAPKKGGAIPPATGADPGTPAPEEPSLAEPAELTLPQQKEAKLVFNAFLKKNGVKEASALLEKFEARRWSDLTPAQMGRLVAEISAK